MRSSLLSPEAALLAFVAEVQAAARAAMAALPQVDQPCVAATEYEVVDAVLARAALKSFQLGGCRIYAGCTSDCYPRVSVAGQVRAIHRAALMRKLGRPLKPGEWALHVCDTKNCYAEDHLFAGTNADNQQDAIRKGRRRPYVRVTGLVSPASPASPRIKY